MLVETISNKLGLHLLKFECNDLSSFTAVHTETKLRNIFLKSKLCSPCIVLLNNFQVSFKYKVKQSLLLEFT